MPRPPLPTNCKEPIIVNIFKLTCPTGLLEIQECTSAQESATVEYTGAGNLVYSLDQTAPSWMIIDQTGVITYSPPAGSVNNWVFNVQVTDGIETRTCIREVFVTANEPPTIDNCPDSIVWEETVQIPDYQLNATDPEGLPVTWQISAGALPAGLTFTNGLLSGTPTTPGSGTVTISALDACGKKTDCILTWTVESACCPNVADIQSFCYNHAWRAGNENAPACEKSWQIVASNDCPNGGFDMMVSPASDRIVFDQATGKIVLQSGYVAPGEYTISYAAKSENGTICAGKQYTLRSVCPTKVGINTGFHLNWANERPYIDQVKLAAYQRYENGNVVNAGESAGWPVDANYWPTDTGVTYELRWYDNFQAPTQQGDWENHLKDDCFSILWEGTANVSIVGNNIPGAVTANGSNELTVQLNRDVIGNIRTQWVNTDANDPLKNMRIVPCRYRDDYVDWTWEDFDCLNPDNNPPLFDEDWLANMHETCMVRFAQGWSISDWTAFRTNSDNTAQMLSPSFINFYDNMFSGLVEDPLRPGLRAMSMPPEMLAYLGKLCPNLRFTVSFESATWLQLQNGDNYPEEFARRMCECGYDKEVKVEFGNEPWNKASVFSVFSNWLETSPHPDYSGPVSRDTGAISYALTAKDVVKSFIDGYCEPCKVVGVFNSHHYRTDWPTVAMPYIDTNYLQSLETAPYYSNDILLRSDTVLYQAIVSHYAGGGTDQQFFDLMLDEITDSSWVNAGSAGPKHDLVALCDLMSQNAAIAHANGMMYSIYEAGFHINVAVGGPGHLMTGNDAIVRDAILAFLQSDQARQADRAVIDCAVDNCAAYVNFYSMSTQNDMSIWSYLHNNYAPDNPRWAQIGNFNENEVQECTGTDTNFTGD